MRTDRGFLDEYTAAGSITRNLHELVDVSSLFSVVKNQKLIFSAQNGMRSWPNVFAERREMLF